MLIPPPKHEVDSYVPTVTQSVGQMEHDRIQRFLNVEPWMCPNCGLKNFGRNEKCANYNCRRDR